MWTVVESKDAAKILDRLPPQVAEKYAVWLAIVRHSGPAGLRNIKSFHDEKLPGYLAHLRSSRLSLQWRVIYRVEAQQVLVYVERVSPMSTGSERFEMKQSKPKKVEYVAARARISLTPGDAVRVTRELQEMTQAKLAAASGIAQGTISSIEKGRVAIGVERAEKLARALRVHPAVLVWPSWDANQRSAG
jgi:DNA-binding XRE family transcriptional regulator/plasmid maintenance system killer protein